MELTARQLACKAIHGDRANVSNPSIMAKYMEEHTNSKLNKIIKELEEKQLDLPPSFAMGIAKALQIVKKEITKTD